MRVSLDLRHALAAGGIFALAMLVGCSDSTPTGVATAPAIVASSPVALLTSADVVRQGGDLGAFVNSITPNESGYLTTEFWDNPSNDGANCDIGFYAVGTMGTCNFQAPGSDANQGGFAGGKYWGNGPENRKTSSFMFSGTYAYKVTFLGSYALENSEVGYFTKTAGGVYSFFPLWTTKAVGEVKFIPPTGGVEWGFYLKHIGHEGLGCAANTDCSDALGDMHEVGEDVPVQQFALMTNVGETRYLVGIEDNEQVGVIGDDDFQDIMLSVEAFPVPMFVVGDVEDHGIGDMVNFWGAQWWKNNFMSGVVSNGVAAFKGYTVQADGFCGGTWTTLPGNSSNPPATIGEYIGIIVTNTVLKAGNNISGNIQQILLVKQDGGYGPNPGHAGKGEVTAFVCGAPD